MESSRVYLYDNKKIREKAFEVFGMPDDPRNARLLNSSLHNLSEDEKIWRVVAYDFFVDNTYLDLQCADLEFNKWIFDLLYSLENGRPIVILGDGAGQIFTPELKRRCHVAEGRRIKLEDFIIRPIYKRALIKKLPKFAKNYYEYRQRHLNYPAGWVNTIECQNTDTCNRVISRLYNADINYSIRKGNYDAVIWLRNLVYDKCRFEMWGREDYSVKKIFFEAGRERQLSIIKYCLRITYSYILSDDIGYGDVTRLLSEVLNEPMASASQEIIDYILGLEDYEIRNCNFYSLTEQAVKNGDLTNTKKLYNKSLHFCNTTDDYEVSWHIDHIKKFITIASKQDNFKILSWLCDEYKKLKK